MSRGTRWVVWLDFGSFVQTTPFQPIHSPFVNHHKPKYDRQIPQTVLKDFPRFFFPTTSPKPPDRSYKNDIWNQGRQSKHPGGKARKWEEYRVNGEHNGMSERY